MCHSWPLDTVVTVCIGSKLKHRKEVNIPLFMKEGALLKSLCFTYTYIHFLHSNRVSKVFSFLFSILSIGIVINSLKAMWDMDVIYFGVLERNACESNDLSGESGRRDVALFVIYKVLFTGISSHHTFVKNLCALHFPFFFFLYIL